MHSCPDCGQACYCHGDIDDCEVETPAYSSLHCVCCEDRPEDFDDDSDRDDLADDFDNGDRAPEPVK